MSFRKVVIVACIIIISGCQGIDVATRLAGGIPADSVSRFPHHVLIRAHGADSHVCSGSIITDQWILTSLKCVGSHTHFTVEFMRLNLNSLNDTYSVVMYNPMIQRYPTEFDDIALLKIPMSMLFDKELKAISISNEPNIMGKLGVLPGYENTTKSDALTYGMFQIIGPEDCTKEYKSTFDKYLNLCAVEWKHFKNLACGTDLGAGLVINWPQNPQLVGILSQPEICNSGGQIKAVFTDLSRYRTWIEVIIEKTLSVNVPVANILDANPTNWNLTADNSRPPYGAQSFNATSLVV